MDSESRPDRLVAFRLLDRLRPHEAIVLVQRVEGRKKHAQHEQILQNRYRNAQQRVGDAQSRKVKDLAHQPAGNRHDEDHGDEHRDETARSGYFGVEPQPSADLRAETRGEPDARHDPCKGAYLHDKALAPSVPDGQHQHEADD